MSQATNEPCSVFCKGLILHTIELAGIYTDSKTFVDMPLKYDPSVVRSHFQVLNETGKKSRLKKLQEFLRENFIEVGSDLEPFTPVDWTDSPNF